MAPAARDWLGVLLERERLPEDLPPLRSKSCSRRWLPALSRQAQAVDAPLLAGLCGAQGSGKSTAAAAIASLLEESGLPTAVLSIDDFYRTRAEREHLAREVHPLLLTRGVPGTHDVAADGIRHRRLARRKPPAVAALRQVPRRPRA